MHYYRWYAKGHTDTTRLFGDVPERLWNRVTKTDTCWLWNGTVSPDGYGSMTWGGRYVKVHHVALELDGRPRPEGLETDHLCRVRNCVNPDHLEWVTHAENVRRKPPELVGTANRLKTICKYGHEYTEDNTSWYHKPDGSWKRDCVACTRRKSKALYAKRKAARAASA